MVLLSQVFKQVFRSNPNKNRFRHRISPRFFLSRVGIGFKRCIRRSLASRKPPPEALMGLISLICFFSLNSNLKFQSFPQLGRRCHQSEQNSPISCCTSCLEGRFLGFSWKLISFSFFFCGFKAKLCLVLPHPHPKPHRGGSLPCPAASGTPC